MITACCLCLCFRHFFAGLKLHAFMQALHCTHVNRDTDHLAVNEEEMPRALSRLCRRVIQHASSDSEAKDCKPMKAALDGSAPALHRLS